jgi:hypothetical protein
MLGFAGPALAQPCSDPADLGIDLSAQASCDPLVPERCILPLPNDYYTVPDATTRTRRRIAFTTDNVPKNVGATPMDVVELSTLDGFSPGSARSSDADGRLVQSAAPSITDIGRSLEADSPIVVVDTRSGKRWPLWAELDQNSPADNRALIVRPAVNFLEGHRYVVAVRHMVDGGGMPLAPSPAFAAYRDLACTTDATFEGRRPHMESLFKTLGRAGVARTDLQLAWDFTIASGQAIAGRLLAMRDDAFAALGGRAPVSTITSVQENPAAELGRRIKGTPRSAHMTGGGAPGQRLAPRPSGRPVRQASPFVAPSRAIFRRTPAGRA